MIKARKKGSNAENDEFLIFSGFCYGFIHEGLSEL